MGKTKAAEVFKKNVQAKIASLEKDTAISMVLDHIRTKKEGKELIKRLDLLNDFAFFTIEVPMKVTVDVDVVLNVDEGNESITHMIDNEFIDIMNYDYLEIKVPVDDIEETKEFKTNLKKEIEQYKKSKEALLRDAEGVIERYASQELGFEGDQLKEIVAESLGYFFDGDFVTFRY